MENGVKNIPAAAYNGARMVYVSNKKEYLGNMLKKILKNEIHVFWNSMNEKKVPWCNYPPKHDDIRIYNRNSRN